MRTRYSLFCAGCMCCMEVQHMRGMVTKNGSLAAMCVMRWVAAAWVHTWGGASASSPAASACSSRLQSHTSVT